MVPERSVSTCVDHCLSVCRYVSCRSVHLDLNEWNIVFGVNIALDVSKSFLLKSFLCVGNIYFPSSQLFLQCVSRSDKVVSFINVWGFVPCCTQERGPEPPPLLSLPPTTEPTPPPTSIRRRFVQPNNQRICNVFARVSYHLHGCDSVFTTASCDRYQSKLCRLVWSPLEVLTRCRASDSL